jgi:PAT family beta-lactamase induction signal transducer AmpG
MFGLVDTFLPIFTIQELDWTNTSYSQVYSSTTIVGGFFGMFIGGYLVDYFGTKKMTTAYLIALVITIGALGLMPSLWGNGKVIFGFVLLYYLMYTFLCIGLFAACMKLCWNTVAATQFTLFMALSNMGRAYGSGLVGTFKEIMSWEYVLLITALMPFTAIFLLRLMNFKKHREIVEQFVIIKTN